MNDQTPAVFVKDLYKSFKLPHEQHSGIKQLIVNFAKRKKGHEVQHVLEDISFEIKKGEFFGIVGRNGSGKSTLLKLLAGIYTPDKGHVQINGSLTPFIELGVGFNPELTGRENVFMNGALLGFDRKQMLKMYPDIVEFAELGRFMDQKLKNYSSGMQVRLAFSIAIRAKSDILLLDEVLAVGDEAFQKKCFSYFEQLKAENKTVILVTHDMGSVKRFCTKAILIEDGEIKAAGLPDDIANQYTLDNLSVHDKDKVGNNEQQKRMSVSGNVTSIRIKPNTSHVLSRNDTLEFEVEYEYQGSIKDLYLGISLLYRNVSIIEHAARDTEPYKDTGKKITYRYKLPLDRFTQGDFTVSAAVLTKKEKDLVAFTTEQGNFSFAIINKGEKPQGGILLERGDWA